MVPDEGNTTATKDLTKEEFEAQQRSLAAAQNLPEGAVPENREVRLDASVDNDLTVRLREEGVIDDEPMDKSAYERAESEAQRKRAAKDSRTPGGFFPGAFFRVTKGPHEGRVVALTRVISYRNNDDRLAVATGSQEQNYVVPLEIEGRARGDARDGEVLVLNVDDAGLERVDRWLGTGRG